MPDSSKAVFLSYASQDAEAARRICEALRAAGVEVWFDQSELRGGDSWDANIRKQIKECALFIPIISANTQARAEGYFRLEWRLADRRTELIGKSKAFLVPVCIDDTREAHADVPDSFCAVQWTRLRQGYGGQAPDDASVAAFCARVKALLDGPVGLRPSSAAPPEERPRAAAVPANLRRPAIALYAMAVIALGIVAAVWQPWRQRGSESTATLAAPAQSSSASEVAGLRARLVPHAWKQDDFEPYSAALDRIIAANEQNADAWALRSIINSLLVIRNYEAGTKPLETGRVAANRALYLDPSSGLGELALGLHFSAMISRGGDPRAPWPHLERAFAKLPADPLTRFAEVSTAYNAHDFERTIRAANNWLQVEPNANHAAFILALTNLARRDWAETVKWAEKGTTADNISGARAYATVFDAHYYLRADLKAARAALERIPAGVPAINRTLHSRWLLAMAERKYDLALQELTRTTETTFFDRTYRGPKALLTGLTHRAAGRADVAQVEFREAERVLREQLVSDPQWGELHAGLALTLACIGRADDARRELAFVEPAMRGRARNVYTGYLMVVLAQTHAMLGQTEPMVFWLRELLSGPITPPFTPASLRIDPRFQGAIETPAVQALLAEFAHLDTRPDAASGATGKSIAVLAFRNLSDEKDNDVFSDGISAELTNVLGRVPGLRVPGSASAFFFKGKGASVQEIGQKLGVGYIVNGTVKRSNGRVRISAELINAADGFQLWSSENFDRELKDVWAVQDEIVGVIAQNLKLRLGSAARPAQSVNPEAHRLVIEGRHFWNLRTEDDLKRAEEKFTQAVEIDPQFAAAHAGLADAKVIIALYSGADGVADVRDYLARGRAAALRAQALDPLLPEPLGALAYAAAIEGDLATAERTIARAIERNPNHGTSHQWRGIFLARMGRLEEALSEFELGVQLDPLSSIHQWVLGEGLAFAGRHEQALEVLERAAALRSTPFLPHLAERATAELKAGRRAEAVANARLIRASWPTKHRWWADGYAVWILREAGETAEAASYANEIIEKLPPESYQRGVVLAAGGRFDEALPFLERTPHIARRILFWAGLFDRYRADARFERLMTNLGCLDDYKRARETQARVLWNANAKE